MWRAAVGVRGDLGDASGSFLRNLSYDVYYSFAHSEDTSRQEGAASRSHYAQAMLRPNRHDGAGGEHLRPEPFAPRR